MDRTHSTALALAVAAGLGVPARADTVVLESVLVGVTAWGNAGSSAATITSSSATWSYDAVSGVMSQTGGTLNLRFRTAPATTLFRHLATGLIVGAGAAATASSYACQEGNFGSGVGASLCGNYHFGTNLLDESSTAWGPGTTVTRALGGDDVASGEPVGLSAFDGLDTLSWDGTYRVLSNRTCVGPGSCGTVPGGWNSGYDFRFAQIELVLIPVPAAVWLFGSAVGVLGLARRRHARPEPRA